MKFKEYKQTIIHLCSRLTQREKVATSLICRNWLAPLYSAFTKEENWGDESVLDQSRNLIKLWLQGNRTKIDDLLKKLESVTPHSEDFGSILGSYAIDAAIVHAYSLELLDLNKDQTLYYVMQNCYDTIDFYVQETLDPNGTVSLKESAIENHELMLREIHWQTDLLKEIREQTNLFEIIEKHSQKLIIKIA